MILGEKRQQFYDEFLSKYIPNKLKTYIEPFGGSFSVGHYILLDHNKSSPDKLIYNDTIKYDIEIKADIMEYLDYSKLINKYDSDNTFFYLDPPYYGKEYFYDLETFNHKKLRDILLTIEGDFILSYEDNKYIRDLYKDFNIIKYVGMKHAFRNEIIILKK